MEMLWTKSLITTWRVRGESIELNRLNLSLSLLTVGRGRSGHFLAKSSIFNAFEEGIRQSHVVRHFGVNFLNMLDRGIYMSPRYILDLKVSEYSRTFVAK